MAGSTAAAPFRVLLVEDNPGDAGWVEMALAGPGFQLSWSRSFGAAASALADGSFDAILLDLGLPDCSRKHTFRNLRDLAPATPVLTLTTFRDERESVSVLGEGAMEYLLKGESLIDSLPAAIHTAVERHRETPLLVNETVGQRRYIRAVESEAAGLPS